MTTENGMEDINLKLTVAVSYLGVESVAESLGVTADVLHGLMEGRIAWSETLRERFEALLVEMSNLGWDLAPAPPDLVTREEPESGGSESAGDDSLTLLPDESDPFPQELEPFRASSESGASGDALGGSLERIPSTDPCQLWLAYLHANTCSRSTKLSNQDKHDWIQVGTLLRAIALVSHGLSLSVEAPTPSKPPMSFERALRELDRVSLICEREANPRREKFVRAKLAEALQV